MPAKAPAKKTSSTRTKKPASTTTRKRTTKPDLSQPELPAPAKHDLIPEHFLQNVKPSSKSFDIMSTPLLKPSKSKVTIKVGSSVDKPGAESKPLKHSVKPIDLSVPVASVEPKEPVAAPKQDLKPLELPDLDLVGLAKSSVDEEGERESKTGSKISVEEFDSAWIKKQQLRDPFEEVLEELEHNEFIQGAGPAPEDLTIGHADRIYKTLKGETKTQAELDADIIDLDGPDEVSFLSAKHKRIEQTKPNVNDTNFVHQPLKDRHSKAALGYAGEFLVVVLLSLIFVYILIDAGVLKVGIELPFDLV